MPGLFDEKKSLAIAEIVPIQETAHILSVGVRGLGHLALRLLDSIVEPLGYGPEVEMRKNIENNGYLVDVNPGIFPEV